jgi:hypothetical protein
MYLLHQSDFLMVKMKAAKKKREIPRAPAMYEGVHSSDPYTRNRSMGGKKIRSAQMIRRGTNRILTIIFIVGEI